MDICDFKQGLYETVVYVLGIRPKNVESITHSVDKVYVKLKNNQSYIISIEEVEDHCLQSDIDIYSSEN